jgi:hypothetical protein
VIGQAEQKIGEIRTREATIEIEVPVIVAACKSEGCLCTQSADVPAELQRMAALSPRQIIGPLVSVGEGEARFSKPDAAGPAAEIERWQTIES